MTLTLTRNKFKIEKCGLNVSKSWRLCAHRDDIHARPNPCRSRDMFNFETELVIKRFNLTLWHLKTRKQSNEVFAVHQVKIGSNLATVNITLLPHSLHCKVLALISTHIVIVGYGSYRSSKGELWVFFFLSVFFCIFHVYILSFSVSQCAVLKLSMKVG